MQAGCCRHVHQGIQGKQVDLAAHQVGYARLRNTEELGGLRLTHFGASHVFLERHHQEGSQFHVFCLLGRVLDSIPHTGKSFIEIR